jgi:iron complex transport system ATP-binding protein
MELIIRNASLGYGNRIILQDINLCVGRSELLFLLGPNGVRKTNLSKSILSFLKPVKGEILFNGLPVSNWNRREFAQNVAYIPQAYQTTFPFTVKEVALFGRTSHLNEQLI